MNDLPKDVTNSYTLSTIKQTIYFFPCENIFNIETLNYMSKGEIIVETQELKDYNYITALNNDLNLFSGLAKTDQYKSHDAEYDNGIIEIKERCTTDRKNPKNGESWCYAKDIFVEEHKLREYAKYKEKNNWKYINIFSASADTNEELIFVYDIREMARKKTFELSEKPIWIQSMKGSDIPPHYDKRWLIPTIIDNKINPDLKIYAKSKSTGKYKEYTEEVYRKFQDKLNSKQHIMGRFDFPHTDKIQKDMRLFEIFR